MTIVIDDDLAKKEAEATVRTLANGSKDLTESPIVCAGSTRLTDEQFDKTLEHIRLRFSMTPRCNLWCVFCSNEGSAYEEKLSGGFVDIEQVIGLSEIVLNNTSLNKIDISGGEPTIHPDLRKIVADKKSRLIEWTYQHPEVRYSIHSNGVTLHHKIVDAVKDNFARIGVSVHSTDFIEWSRLTNFRNMCSEHTQKKKYQKMVNNLEYLSKQDIGEKVFMKSVVMRGYNDSAESLEHFLNACEAYGFHPKFLEFEPQYPSQETLRVGRDELFAKLQKLGCEFPGDAPFHNDEDTYIPGTNFDYGVAPRGLHSIFGCGDKGACMSCFDFLCVFVKTSPTGDIYLKPCAVTDKVFDISDAVKKDDKDSVLSMFKKSREYLMTMPGLGCKGWNKEEVYALDE